MAVNGRNLSSYGFSQLATKGAEQPSNYLSRATELGRLLPLIEKISASALSILCKGIAGVGESQKR